ncbi:MAG: hypothetical protein KBG84_08185 [Planctomycetes bacterium]|nr:hypothetical protein [Planctomycetota bacterium]
MDAVLEYLANVDWLATLMTLILVMVALVLGVWLPGKYIERHTNQPAARYVWYGVGTFTLIMVYVAAYGYGLFWNNLGESEKKDPYVFGKRGQSTTRQ